MGVQFNQPKGKYNITEAVYIKSYMRQHNHFPPSMSLMPFGKYKGKKLREIPFEYLEWLNRQPNLKGKVKQQIERYLGLDDGIKGA